MRKITIPLIAVLLLVGCGQIPGSQGNNQPEIKADKAAVRQYWNQVRPILDDTARDVAKVADVNMKIKDGNVSVGINPNAVQQAQRETRQGLNQLKQIQPPKGLEQTHRRLIKAYSEAIPALNNFIAAVQSGNAGQIASSFRNDLPKIQNLLNEIQNVRQQLQQASN
ncbi:hypothetical protein BH18ACT10_BH18ACT10_08540 [soil metagenome]|nr:hypothetical protein [Rubrobacter sp.]